MSDAMSASDADRKCYSRGNTAKSKTRKAQYEHAKEMSKKSRKRNNSYDLYSEHSDSVGVDSSEGDLSDELISTCNENEIDNSLKANHDDESKIIRLSRSVDKNKVTHNDTVATGRAIPTEASGKGKSKTLINSSEAIGSSIIESIPDESGWHSRRSESEADLSRIHRKQHRSLLKRRRYLTLFNLHLCTTLLHPKP